MPQLAERMSLAKQALVRAQQEKMAIAQMPARYAPAPRQQFHAAPGPARRVQEYAEEEESSRPCTRQYVSIICLT